MNARATMAAMVIGLCGAAGAHAGFVEVAIDPNTYPSAQGWSFFSQNLEEGEAVWLDEAGVLSLNTIGAGDLSEARFDMFLAPETLTDVTQIRVTTRLRVLELESFGGPTERVAISLLGVGGGGAAALRFDDQSVLADGGDPVFLDVSSWHTYEVRVDTETRAMRLFVDGVLVMTGVAPEVDATYLQFGEGFRTNVHAEVTMMRWTLVPAPGAGAMVGLGALLGVRRRRC